MFELKSGTKWSSELQQYVLLILGNAYCNMRYIQIFSYLL